MTIHTRTRRFSAPAYYLGRPAALWLAALAPRSTTHNHLAPRQLVAGTSRRVAGKMDGN